jgi:glutaminyl-peptide cyclotransferase
MLPNGRFEVVGGGLRNVVGTLPGPGPALVIAAHYDTQVRPKGFVGANDSAAGTAAVIELARALRRDLPPRHREIRFVLFDGEELPVGCTSFESCGLRGSRAYLAAHPGETGQMVLLDYIANKGLRIPRETNSDSSLWAQLRAAAQRAGAGSYFPAATQIPIIDDHVSFIQAGVPAIDLIDWAYRYKNTIKDTTDKLSLAALDAVGETVAELAIALATH